MTDRNHPEHAAPEHAAQVTAVEARQGRWGKPILWVLIIGISAAAVALLGIMGIFQI